MTGKQRRSPWGSVRKLPSGRFQAHYQIDGVRHQAPATFRTKRDADAFLATTRTDIGRGKWINPEVGSISFSDYAERWLAQKPDLRPRTKELYQNLLRLHLVPALGPVELNQLSPARVRGWHADLVASGSTGASTIAKAYRLLRGIMQTAVHDELIFKNPCVLRSAGVERPAERPVATVAQVYALADAIEPRFRAMVLLATFCGLRLGELLALRRHHLDLLHKTVKVTEQLHELGDGSIIVGQPKTDAGRRTVAIPDAIVSELEAHVGLYAEPGAEALVFCGLHGQPIRRSNFHKYWRQAVMSVGLDGFHFHDLRHTGNTLAAATGASTKELMSRMGHASPRAALIYQHATQERDAAIAAALNDVIENAATSDRRDSGASVVPIRHS